MRRLRRGLSVGAIAAIALGLVSVAGADNVTHGAEVTVAPGASADVSITITATDDDGDGTSECNASAATPATVTLSASDPISAPGELLFEDCVTQTVTLSATSDAVDGDYLVGVTASGGSYAVDPGAITVHVVTPPPPPPPPDTEDPVLVLPGDFTVEATSASGAVVTFTASATDNVDPAPAVSCTPPSGSTFSITATPVSCTAIDDADNSATGTFTVSVDDTVAPTLTLPAPISAVATSAAGAVVTFTASASDAVAGAPAVTCSPASGSTFSIGVTTVTCNTNDGQGNPASAQFSVTVTDAAPTITLPPTQTVEATGPTGAKVTYTPAPTASDTVDGPLTVSCIPAAGALFALGTTSVTCTATDSGGSPAAGSFQVRVVDTTPPVVTAPADATFVGDGGLPRSTPLLAAYLARGRAADIVDPAPVLYVEAPDVFRTGENLVRYIAVDSAGNRGEDSTIITVVPPPAPGQPRPPAPPADDPPPGNVTALRARPGNRLIRLSWTAPRDADVVRYAAFRSERSGPQVQVYSGAARSFTDRGLVNGVEYRYVVVAYDRGGNRSVGVAVLGTPRLPMLLAPREGARLARATTFSWRRVAGARYYNFQLFRAAGAQPFVKVLSAWPVTNRFTLRASWRFGGRKYQLVPGTYRWFVWPGFGARADARYGDVLGERTFVVTRRR
jgi:hypothetical protein